METTVQLRARYAAAFKRFATEEARMRLRAAKATNETEWAEHGRVSAHSRLLVDSEQDYREVRLQYIRRLLTKSRQKEPVRPASGWRD